MSINSDKVERDRQIKDKDQVSRFHTRQALSMLTVFTILIFSFFIMLAKQYNLTQVHEKDILMRHFQERIAHLDNMLARVTEHVEGMRITAEANLMQSRVTGTLNQSIEFENLTEVIDEERFHLDVFTPPITQERIGNLTGQGSIQNRGKVFYREVRMALGLNPLFLATNKAIKNSAWVYYTSRNNFINIYPWVSSSDFKFSKELYTHEFYTLGLPDKNPDREMFWTKVYVDEYGKGLMTTCAVPVYDNDQFMGTAAIDLTVDFLNTVVKNFNPRQGVMFLVNDRNQLLAHPSLITSLDKRAKLLSEGIPEALRDSLELIKQSPDNRIISVGSFNILRSRLRQAPWQVFYIEQRQAFWTSFIDMIGVGSIVVLSMLVVLIIAVITTTHNQFIMPSKKFVRYIMNRSKRISTQIDNKIPHVWRPWFNAVEEVFRENENLTQELQKQNENLDQRVRQRTAELEKEVEERKEIQETLRKSEERFRDISYSMADFIWEVDSRGKFYFISESVKQILGYDPEEIVGKSPGDLMPEEEAGRVGRLWNELVSEKKPIVDLENWNIHKNGERICLLTNGLPVFNDKGVLTRYRGVNKDITYRKIAQEEQKELQARLQRAEKMESIGTLAGGVAHDLNNILSGIVSYPDLILVQLPKDSPLREPIETVKESGLKAAAIVQDLLTLARRGVATTEVLNLNRVIAEYLDSPEYTKLKSFHPELRMNTHLEEKLLNIMGSPVHLSKTIMNLVSNAAEAIPGRGEIDISTGNIHLDRPIKGYDEVKEGDYVVLTVYDTGIGINPKDKDKIFEPFYTKKVMGRSGTGLGMAVVWGTVKDHAGYIDVQSNDGKGTRFTLYFPVTRKDMVKTAAPVSINENMGNGESVLVIDDSKEQREIAGSMLNQLGYNVSTVSSGEQAVEYIKENKVDLLFLDMIMDPGIDGLDTYKQIIEIYPRQKAIISSGFSETERIKEAQRLGAGKYLKKPYTLEILAVSVKEALKGE